MKYHRNAHWTNSHGELMTSCGISGYETLGTSPNSIGGWNTERVQVSKLLIIDNEESVNCKNCLKVRR